MKKILFLFFLASATVAIAKPGHLLNTSVQKTTFDLSEYAGKYKFEDLPFEFLEIKLTDGKLMVDAGGQGGEIKKEEGSEDVFKTEDGGAKFTFKRNDEKKITKITLDYQGTIFEGTKLP